MPRRSAAEAVERIAGWSDALHEAEDPTELLQRATDTVTLISGFDGTWACQIEPDGHGVVAAATVVGPTDTVVDRLVLSTDMPPAEHQQAPRPVPFFVTDVAADSIDVEPAGLGELDVGDPAVREVYGPYLRRLHDLGVRSTLSVPIVVDRACWGMLIAHHPRVAAVAPSVQAELRLLGLTVGSRLGELLERDRTRARLDLAVRVNRLLTAVGRSADMLDGLAADPQALLGLCDASGAVVSIDERSAAVELPLTSDDMALLVADARERLLASDEAVVESSDLTGELRAKIDPSVVSGYLAATLGQDTANLVIWVRPEVTRAVRWVQHETVATGEDAPDNLFLGLRERVEQERGTSARWGLRDLDAVRDFRAALGDLMLARVQQVARHNRELTRSNQEFDAFAHAAAHDLKQPIRGISQYTEFFLEDVGQKLENQEREQLEIVLRLSGKMTGLLDSLMRYAQLGEASWLPAPISLPEAVDDALELLPLADREGAIVEAQDTQILADPDALRQLLLNLVGNACKYADDVPVVSVGVTTLAEAAKESTVPPDLGDHPADALVLVVRDQGIGIDPAYHQDVFALFRKLHAQGPKAAGSGAGLALCQRIARRHGGDIWLESEAGAGAAFFVVLSPAARLL